MKNLLIKLRTFFKKQGFISLLLFIIGFGLIGFSLVNLANSLQIIPDDISAGQATPGFENTPDSLVIAKIGLDYNIVEGKEIEALERGIWHRPQSSTPDKGGNTVLAGHRYKYISGPHTLYSLDKVAVGDQIIVNWQGKKYTYDVFETKVVKPTAIEIENNTKYPILTLYTCTPVFTTLKRLVVVAKLSSVL